MEKQFNPLSCLQEMHSSLTSIRYESAFCRDILSLYPPALVAATLPNIRAHFLTNIHPSHPLSVEESQRIVEGFNMQWVERGGEDPEGMRLDELIQRVDEVRQEHIKNKIKRQVFTCECKKTYPSKFGLSYHKRYCRSRPRPAPNRKPTRRPRRSLSPTSPSPSPSPDRPSH